ncbi:hypothetical protein ACQR0Z_14830 [Bradyrhizobium sp. HKCCYLS3077]|uniref:hypothetical protein n=1 Tax=Bradyrhizobium sp. HKCCYLS3077 TaxID=3420761 RepID=UPI003EBF9C38
MADFPHRVRFVDATHRDCKFFLPGESGMFGFACGAPCGEGESFCECHYRHCFRTLTRVSRTISRNDDVVVCEIQIEDSELELTGLVCGGIMR